MWQQGDYYPGPGPENGLAIARMVGMVSYRTEQLFEERFRTEQNKKNTLDDVESYLRYHGEKLVRRFDANTYLLFLEAMNHFDLGHGRGGIDKAVSRIQAEVLTIGIKEDLYFPVRQQREFHTICIQNKVNSRYLELSSHYGHDAFLVEYDQFGAQVKEFIES
jgi:homoserine O-acetyltransferase